MKCAEMIVGRRTGPLFLNLPMYANGDGNDEQGIVSQSGQNIYYYQTQTLNHFHTFQARSS